MLECSSGKISVLASSFNGKRLKLVSAAAEKMAKRLDLSFEIKTFRKSFRPIYVYYKMGDNEPIPLYCNTNSQSDMDEVFSALRDMMFVLSFHPKHQALRHIRKEITLFS